MRINPYISKQAHWHFMASPRAKAAGVSYSKSPPAELRTINEIRLVSQHRPKFHSAGIDVWVETGSGDEIEPEVKGISHFIEHMLFKGTKTRSNLDILLQTEGLGGDLDAFTDIEQTCYHIVSLREFSTASLEVLLDMVQNPRLDKDDIKTEQKVVIQEIKRCQDTPEIRVLGLSNEIMFGVHPYGGSILGDISTVKSFDPEMLKRRTEKFHVSKNLSVSISGNFDIDAIISTIDKTAPPKKINVIDFPVPSLQYNSGIVIENKRNSEQAHIVLATKGVSLYDDDKYLLEMIDIALGRGMISRLFQKIRQERGLAYNVETINESRKLGGMFSVYAASDHHKALKVIDLILKEFADLKKNGLSPKEFERTRNQFRSKLLMIADSAEEVAHDNGFSQLCFNRILPLEEIERKVKLVTNDRIISLANKIFDPRFYVLAIVGEKSKLPNTTTFRNRLFK